jgi:hypothetical protein
MGRANVAAWTRIASCNLRAGSHTLFAMKKATVLRVLALLPGAMVFSASQPASALGPLDVEIAAKAGVGTTPSNVPSGVPNPLGFGIGARGGVSILGLYGGLSFIYYLGGSQSVGAPGLGSLNESVHALMYGFEGGYGIKLVDILTLRAVVGVGNFTETVDVGPLGSASNSNLYVEPGITGIVSLPFVGWFVGADANVLILPGFNNGGGQSQTDTAFTVHGQVGYKF